MEMRLRGGDGRGTGSIGFISVYAICIWYVHAKVRLTYAQPGNVLSVISHIMKEQIGKMG
jgi:hypothetical protein